MAFDEALRPGVAADGRGLRLTIDALTPGEIDAALAECSKPVEVDGSPFEARMEAARRISAEVREMDADDLLTLVQQPALDAMAGLSLTFRQKQAVDTLIRWKSRSLLANRTGWGDPTDRTILNQAWASFRSRTRA